VVRAAYKGVRAAYKGVRAAYKGARAAYKAVRAAYKGVRAALKGVRAALEEVRAALEGFAQMRPWATAAFFVGYYLKTSGVSRSIYEDILVTSINFFACHRVRSAAADVIQVGSARNSSHVNRIKAYRFRCTKIPSVI